MQLLEGKRFLIFDVLVFDVELCKFHTSFIISGMEPSLHFGKLIPNQKFGKQKRYIFVSAFLPCILVYYFDESIVFSC